MKNYKYIAFVLLLTELMIGIYIHDRIIRPYVGDLLVAILVYCTIKSFVDTPVNKTVLGVLLFCYAIEISQYFHLIVQLGLQNSYIAHLMLGSSFSWIDMLCYTMGMAMVWLVESINSKYKSQPV